MKLLRWGWVVVSLLASLAAPPAAAQTQVEGSIRGYVRDPQGAVMPGVTITAASPSVSRPFTATSDSDGYYRLTTLPPGEYTITAELAGFATQKREGILVRAGLNLALEIVMQVGGLDELVQVSIETPMLESKSAVQAVNISGDFQRAVPITTRRNWADFMMLTPGVISTETQYQTYFVHGSSFDQSVVHVDGADMASAQQSSHYYTNFNTDAIEDVQVKTGAVDAASPLGTGAVYNVVTRSGTNTFKGAATLDYQGDGWRGNNNPTGTVTGYGLVQTDASLGGPIQRDRLWFFAAYRYANQSQGIGRNAQQLGWLTALVPNFEPFNQDTKGHYYFAKANTQVGRHQVQAFYQYDKGPTDSVGPTSGVKALKTYIGGAAYSGRVNSIWGSSTSTRASVSYNDKTFPSEADWTGPSRTIYDSAFLSGGRLTGATLIASIGASAENDQPYRKLTASADVTHYRSELAGTHELQAGLFLQLLHAESTQHYVNGGYVSDSEVLRDAANPAAGTIAFRRQIYDVDRVTSIKSDSRDVAFYLQDAWSPHRRLTVTAGVRVDIIDRTDRLFDVTLQDSVEIGPRFGVNYILTDDQRNVLRASWGRVHDTLSSTANTAGTNVAGYRELFDNDLDGTFETTFITPASTALSTNRIIDPARHQPFVDEWTVGYRRQFPGRISADVSVLHRDFRETTAQVEVNGIYDNGVFKGYLNEAQNDILQITNNIWNRPVYTAVTTQVTKQSAVWQVLASYTRQWRRIEGTWQPNDPSSFLQPETFPNDRGIGTELRGWRDHAFRAGATWRAPWQLLIGTNVMVESGQWAGPVQARIAASDPRFGPPTVQLSNGRVVSNPLATTIRFAYGTRGEGQFTGPAIVSWNLRIGRDVAIGRGRLEPRLDLFNVTNHDADQLPLSGANQIYNANYGQFGSRQFPRAAQVSLRYVF